MDLEDDDPIVVDALLWFLYTGDYGDVTITQGTRSSTLFHVQVFALAEKFFVQPLMYTAARKFDDSLSKSWCEEDFADAVDEWSRTSIDVDKILGNRVVNILMIRRSDIFKPEQRSARVEELISQIPWLAGETVQMLSYVLGQAEGSMTVYRCPNTKCKQLFIASIEPSKTFKVTCQKCCRVDEMNLTNWKRYAVGGTVVAATVDTDAEDDGVDQTAFGALKSYFPDG